MYTIEGIIGGNNATQFLGIFAASPSGHYSEVTHRQIGGRGLRFAESLKIRPYEVWVGKLKEMKIGIIEIETLEYLDTDSLVEPTGKGHCCFSLINGELIETPGR